MKRIFSALIVALAVAAAAVAAAGWSRRPDPAGCASAAQSELPITAALQLRRCNAAAAR